MTDFFSQFHRFDPFTIGYTDVFKELESMSKAVAKAATYPPYNIKQVNENKFVIEMAVAGFAQSDIEITLEGNKLVVKGNSQDDDTEVDNFLFKGIAARAFTRSFALNDQVEVKDAEIFNGMLKIALERMIPEEKKPKVIDIK